VTPRSRGRPRTNGKAERFIQTLTNRWAYGAMIACALILGDVGGDLGMQSVMLDSVADAAAALGVAISGGVILLTGGTYWLDSWVALAIALVVAFHAVKLLRKVALELRQRPPAASSVGRVVEADVVRSLYGDPDCRRGIYDTRTRFPS
jgi:hypothetical protein